MSQRATIESLQAKLVSSEKKYDDLIALLNKFGPVDGDGPDNVVIALLESYLKRKSQAEERLDIATKALESIVDDFESWKSSVYIAGVVPEPKSVLTAHIALDKIKELR